LPIKFEPYPGIGKIQRKVLRPSRTPAVRVLAVWVVLALLLFYETNKTPLAWQAFEIALAVAIAVFIYPFLDGPVRLHSRGRLELHSGNQLATETTGAPSSVSPDPQIHDLGFEYAGQIIGPAGKRNVGVRMDFYVHSQNQDSAYLAEIFDGLGTTRIVAFKSRFQDDFAFETNNVSNASIFKADPNFRVFRFPQLRFADSLYRIHRRIKERFFADHFPTIANKEVELTNFLARAEIIYQNMAQCGDYQLSPQGDCYRLTWKGAIRQSWLLTWPVKQIRMRTMRSRALKMAREIGLPIDVYQGRISASINSPA